MKTARRILLTLLLVVLAGLICLPVGLVGAGYFLVVRDPIANASAVAVLSGGGIERMDQATNLILDNYARRLIITDTGTVDPVSGTKISRIMADQAAQRGVRKVYIYVTDGESRTTREEALAIKALAVEKSWEKIIVVTDSFHSRRTKTVFVDVFRGSGIRVSVYPVDVEGYWYDPAKWWLDSESRKATVYEYLSLISYKLGIYQE